jgi:hypothetical protein
MVRQVNETSARPNGVEFFAERRGEYERHGKVMGVEKVRGPQNVTINLNVQALDQHGVDAVLRDHGHKIAAHVKRAFRRDMADSSVV